MHVWSFLSLSLIWETYKSQSCPYNVVKGLHAWQAKAWVLSICQNLVICWCFFFVLFFSLFLFLIRINQRNGCREASMLWNRKTFQFLFSVFPLPWFIALPKMPQYVPLHMPGGQRQNTEWERLQRHKQTLQVLERQILPLPRFLSSLHFFQMSMTCWSLSLNH